MGDEKRHTRRGFMQRCAAGWGALTLASHGRARAENGGAARPNILLALTDNQSWRHCGAMGDPIAQTPAFDRVAAEGVLFPNAFCPSPSCTPSRGALLTGQDFWRLGSGGVLHGQWPKDLPLYTDLLSDAGYHVGYTGKGWGPGRWDRETRDHDLAGQPYNKAFLPDVPRNIFSGDYAGNLEAFLDDAAPGQPWCFWFGTKEPHRPFPEGYGKDQGLDEEAVALPAFLPDTPTVRNDYLDYYTELAWQDRHLARMLELLEARGQLENTIVVVTSDNGIQMPRGIANLYDHGTRVPLAIRWGKNAPGGRTVQDFVNLTDLAPTFLAAAGVDVPDAMTGRDLAPVLRSEKAGQIDPKRDAVVTGIERHSLCRPGEVGYPMRMVRTADYLYIRNYEPGRWPAGAPDYKAPAQGFYGDVDNGPTKAWMVAHKDDPAVKPLFALCFGKRPAEELYHVPADPDQVTNLADDPAHAGALARLRERLDQTLADRGDPRARGENPWDAYAYHSLQAVRYRDQFTNPHVLP
ncbi:MAG: sulfatase [Candidatus Hydrogenedentota bacterium]